MSRYIVFWKEDHGQQVHTVVNAHGDVVDHDAEYLDTNGIDVLDSADDVLSALASADGQKYAVTPDLARNVLGWDV